MGSKPNRVTENEVAFAIVQIAKAALNGIATLAICKQEVPNHLKLTGDDLAGSTTRPNEPMWEQQIRNIQSHHATEGNYIREGYLVHVPGVGYQVTDAGRARTHP